MTSRHLPANADLTYFTVTCHLAPIVADFSQDSDYDPNTTRIDATVTFTPKYKTGEVIHSHTSNPPTGFLALPVTAMIDDGYLKLRSKPDLGAAPLPGTLHGLKAKIAADNNIEPTLEADGRAVLNYAPVRLLGNSTSLEIEPDKPLYYDFTFSNIKIDNKPTNIVITGGTFEAPWEDTVIDLLDYMPLSPGPYAAPMVVGPQGPPGERGPQGPATIVVGTTTTGEPGTDAVVTNSGTEQDVVLDFTIPRGDTPLRKYHVDDYGADPTGASSSDAAIAAALAEMGSNPGTIMFGEGTYAVTATVTLGPYQNFEGTGSGTVIRYTGDSDFIRMSDPLPYVSSQAYWPTSDPASLGGPRLAGSIKRFFIDGTGSGPNACAIHLGDVAKPIISDVTIINFKGANAKGIWFDNRITWCEKAVVERAFVNFCKEAVVFESVGGSSKSFGYGSFDFNIGCEVDQTGVRFTNAYLYSLTGLGFNVGGGFFNGPPLANNPTSNTGAVLRFTADSVLDGYGSISVESNGAQGYPGHQTIVNEPGTVAGGSAFIRWQGKMRFLSTSSTPFRDGTGPNSQMAFSGVVDVDDKFGRHGDSIHVMRVVGGMTGTRGTLSSNGKWFYLSGNWFTTSLNPGVTPITLATYSKQLNNVQSASYDIFLKQPSTGDAKVTWPSNFIWPSGLPPQLSTRPNATDWIRVETPNFVDFYAEHVNSRFEGSKAILVDPVKGTSAWIPTLYNDLAYATERGATVEGTFNGTPLTVVSTANVSGTTKINPWDLFNHGDKYTTAAGCNQWTVTNTDVITVTVTLPTDLYRRYTCLAGVQVGQGFRAKDIKIEAFYNNTWNILRDAKNLDSPLEWVVFDGGANDVNQLRYTFTNFESTQFRLLELSFLNMSIDNRRMLSRVLPRGGGAMFGSTTKPVAIQASGSDTAVGINLVPKGAGTVQVSGTQVEVKGHTHTVAQVTGAAQWVSVPASATATGTPGQLAADAAGTFLYVCVAANTWRRVALTAW